MEPRGMEYFSAQVLQKDVGGRLQVGQELLLYLGAPGAIPDLEEDQNRLAKTLDALTGWVGSSNYQVRRGDPGRRARAGVEWGPRGSPPERALRTDLHPTPRGWRHVPRSGDALRCCLARREPSVCGSLITRGEDRVERLSAPV